MGAIEWDERYSVGVEELDEQHKQLFRILDALFESEQAAVDSREILNVLAELREYAALHFATEERYMAEWGYPDLANHKWAHAQYRKKVDELCSGGATDPDTVLSNMIEFLYTWLSVHILSCDKDYARLACSHQK